MPDEPKHSNPTVAYGWQNALTIPREVFLKDGRVMQYPVEELYRLRKEMKTLKNDEASEEMSVYDVEISVCKESDFTMLISDGIKMSFCRKEKLFTLSFDEEKNLGCGRQERAVLLETCSEIRVLADTSCLEVYINGGQEVFTTRFYTESGKSDFCVLEGASEIKYWEMESMKV